MIPIDIQVSRFKVKGQAYYTYVGEGGISVLQTSILTTGFSTHKVMTTELIVTENSNNID